MLRTEDLPRLRSWANDGNPVYKDGLAVLAANAKADVDNNLVPENDGGGNGNGELYPTEMYAELFAFMSLIEKDQVSLFVILASQQMTAHLHGARDFL